jgi:hypothetical protein
MRTRFVGDLEQPAMRVIRYRWPTPTSQVQEAIDGIGAGLQWARKVFGPTGSPAA